VDPSVTVRLEGLGKLKNKKLMNSSEFKPTIFPLAALRLKLCLQLYYHMVGREHLERLCASWNRWFSLETDFIRDVLH
jgi:hypothetical protein